MTRRKLCVVCDERPACSIPGALCAQCDRAMELAPEWDASWAARRARAYAVKHEREKLKRIIDAVMEDYGEPFVDSALADVFDKMYGRARR